MGKTESGAVWLSAERTSPYAFYQYWMNVADADAGTCLRLLTELPREEIEALDASRRDEPHQRQSQRRLAQSLTATGTWAGRAGGGRTGHQDRCSAPRSRI